jgi:hypothetical protein
VGQVILRQLKGRVPRRAFRYFDKGHMAVVGKNFECDLSLLYANWQESLVARTGSRRDRSAAA